MKTNLFDSAIVGGAQEAVDFIGSVLESSTEYSIIGSDLDGKILLWNEGARRIYGYEPEEVVGKANSSLLHTPEDVNSGKPREMMATALQEGKWEGTIDRVRKNGSRFVARVVLTPRRDPNGRPIGFLLISKDISSEIRLTEELQATQFYTRSLIESNIDALMTTDPVGIITDVNQQMEALTGCTRQELIGTPFKNYFTDPARAEEGIRLVLRETKVKNYELTALSKDGRMTVVSYNASTFRDSAGKLQGVFASARDITEQSRLQNQLAEERAYNRGLIEASLDGLITVDPMIAITDVNETMCRMSGYTREQLIGSPFSQYFTHPQRAAEGVRLTLDRGAVTNYELTLRTRDGQEILVSFNAAIFKDKNDAVRGIFASARDIRAQKQLESQLQASQVYTRSLIESNIDALMTTDPLGIISDVNQQMEALTGLSRYELIGSPFKTYFTEPERAEEAIKQVLSEGKVTNYELTARRKDGHETVVSYNAATLFDQDGKLQGVFAAARDVTERKRFEQTLQEKNIELENANLAKDRFLANMSHELRTPLNAIIGFTGTLLMRLPGPLTSDQDQQLKTIQASARHLLSLINDLLNLAKIESGKADLYIEEVDCQQVLKDVAASLLPMAEAKGLRLEFNIPPEDWSMQTDQRSLQQIILNLTSNAIKFTDTGGVTLRLGRLHEDHQRFVEIRVVDTGIGIRPEDQDRLFQAFEQINLPGARHQEGTGLGLHLSKKLATLLGGTIRFESEYRKGSTFILALPEVPSPVQSSPESTGLRG